jgi:hypothetical protein
MCSGSQAMIERTLLVPVSVHSGSVGIPPVPPPADPPPLPLSGGVLPLSGGALPSPSPGPPVAGQTHWIIG